MSATEGRDEAARTGPSIIQVTLWDSPYLGNFMVSQLALADAVRERFGLGTHFVLAAGAEGQQWLAELERIGATWSLLPRDRSAWRGHLDEQIPERSAALIHTNFTAADLQAAAAASAAEIPCVWQFRTGFTGYPVAQRIKDLYKLRFVARRRVARIVTVSPWLGQLTRRRGAAPDRVEVVPNPILADRFAQLPDREAARARFGLKPGAEVVLALGWWPKTKGVDVLLDAAVSIAPQRPDLQVLIVGEDEMRSFLARRSSQPPEWLRLSNFVRDPAWLYAAADVFVSASRHEGMGNAVGEALASGLPVVMSDIGGHARWSEAAGTFLFDSEDAPALATRLDQLLSAGQERRLQAGEENRRWAVANAGADAWIAGICAVYEPLLIGHRP